MSCVTVFGGTGFVGRRVVRHLRELGIRVRIVSRHRGLGEDAGIEQIAADAHDQRSVDAAVATQQARLTDRGSKRDRSD
jgi:uncharacterized protein YbjT (DUF2867 family)